MTPDTPSTPAPPTPTFGQALRYWLWLGCISFGGPAGQIAILHEDLVVRRRWISEQRFLHALNYCMLLPGPEAQQLATYIGWLMHRTRGGIAAGALFVLPSLLLLCGLSWLYMVWGQTPAVAAVLFGIKPAVTAIVAAAAWRIGKRALKTPGLRMIALLAFIGVAGFQLPFPLIVLAAALAGAVGQRCLPGQFAAQAAHAAAAGSGMAAVIDDHTPVPAHARFGWGRCLRVLLVGLGLWLLTLALLWACCGLQGVLMQMAWFFTKAALLTFGGAYAVLPYVVQGAVEQQQWLTALQMMDGLALGETTPGPLIMVVSFVGFVGGWGQAVFGADHLLAAGLAAAVVVTWFTFLPSFIFIFLGGPFIESMHGNLKFSAPLSGITAAVVGVIVNLAVYFAWQVLWPQGWGRAPDGAALAIGCAAALALFRYQQSVIRVVLGAALAGLLWRLLPWHLIG